MGQCILFADQNSNTCGPALNSCVSCPTAQSCLSGVCRVDPSWAIVVKSAILSDVDANLNPWDSFGGALPDPFVTGALTNDVVVDWTTATIDNTVTPFWNEQVSVTYSESALIAQGLEFNILDSDSLSFETIANCIMPISKATLLTGTKTMFCGPLAMSLTIDFIMQ